MAIIGGLHAAGFGIFLAAVTKFKAMALLTGIGLGFEFYLGVTTFLGFLTGPVGLALTMALASGTAGLAHYRKYRRSMLLNLLAAMHYRLNVPN